MVKESIIVTLNRLTGRSSYYSIIVMDSRILEGLGIDYFTV